jgi:beta-lactamase class A
MRRTRVFLGALTVIAALVVSGILLARSDSATPPDAQDLVGDPPSVAALPASLDDRLAAMLADADDCRVGVALADVSGDAVQVFGDESAFFAASTAKIITAAAYYHLAEGAQMRLDESLGDFDAAFQLEIMVNESSNDAWLLLMQAIGYPELIDYAASIGITYDPEENLLTAADMAALLKLLYAGDLLDEDDTAQLLGYMQETNNEELIPAGSRPEIAVHHKYGELEGNLHDAALLSDDTSTFALVVFTEGDVDSCDTDQVELIRSLTRVVEDELFPVGD